MLNQLCSCSSLQLKTSSRCMTTGSPRPIRTDRLKDPHCLSQWKRSRSPCRRISQKTWCGGLYLLLFVCVDTQLNVCVLCVCQLDSFYCSLCGKHSNSERQWMQHITSEKHKHRVLSGEGEDESLAWTFRFPGRSFSLCHRYIIHQEST